MKHIFKVASAVLGWGDISTFWLNFIAMIPLAKILGDATEELAVGLRNDTVGGLINLQLWAIDAKEGWVGHRPPTPSFHLP